MKYKNNKNSLMMRKKIIMRRRRVAMLIIVGLMISIVLLVIKLNQPQIIGYRYDTGNDEYLNLSTIVGYDVSENGILLHTSDGNGYYIEN